MKLRKKNTLTDWMDVGEGMEIKIDYPTREQEQELQTIMHSDKFSGNDRVLKWSQRLIKYTVKDWKGVDEKCVLIGDELENNIWWLLVSEEMNALVLATKIKVALDFTETDKKK